VLINEAQLGITDRNQENGLEALVVRETKFNAQLHSLKDSKARPGFTKEAQEKAKQRMQRIMHEGHMKARTKSDAITLIGTAPYDFDDHDTCGTLYDTSKECHMKTTDEADTKEKAKKAAVELNQKKAAFEEKQAKERNSKESDEKARVRAEQYAKNEVNNKIRATHENNGKVQERSNKDAAKRAAKPSCKGKWCAQQYHTRSDYGEDSVHQYPRSNQVITKAMLHECGCHDENCANQLGMGPNDICGLKDGQVKGFAHGGRAESHQMVGWGCFIGGCRL